jgi:hypothetical protein
MSNRKTRKTNRSRRAAGKFGALGQQAYAAHTKVSGKVFIQVSATTTASSFSLHPGNIPRLTEIANAFGLYRFIKLKVSVMPSFRATTSIPGSPEMYYVCYFNQTVDTLPNTTQAGSEAAYSVVRPMGYVFDLTNSSAISLLSVPTGFRVPTAYLIGDTSLKWYKAVVGTTDAWDELQGFIAYRSENSVQLHLMLSYEVEFAVPLPAISTPESVEERLEKAVLCRRLLKLYEEYKAGVLIVDRDAERKFASLLKGRRLAPAYDLSRPVQSDCC